MADTIIIHGQETSRESLKEFKKLYLEAVKENKTMFDYYGQDVLVGYAKHLIEYAESKLGEL